MPYRLFGLLVLTAKRYALMPRNDVCARSNFVLVKNRKAEESNRGKMVEQLTSDTRTARVTVSPISATQGVGVWNNFVARIVDGWQVALSGC
jgi:hypothetical protein